MVVLSQTFGSDNINPSLYRSRGLVNVINHQTLGAGRFRPCVRLQQIAGSSRPDGHFAAIAACGHAVDCASGKVVT